MELRLYLKYGSRGPTILGRGRRTRGRAGRFIVHADEKLTAFLGLESAIWFPSPLPDPQSQKQNGGCRHIQVCTTKVLGEIFPET